MLGGALIGEETGDKFFDRVIAIVFASAILAAGLPIAAYLFRDKKLRPAGLENTGR